MSASSVTPPARPDRSFQALEHRAAKTIAKLARLAG